MGSPLGVLFANFFMGTVEELVFTELNKPEIYCRYIDDIFVKTKDEEELLQLKTKLIEKSGLNFTCEYSRNGALPFLDVLLQLSSAGLSSSVYVKATNPGLCLNGKSECPQRYKESTIGAFVRRAITHCSSWTSTSKELERVTQVLVNNGYSNKEVNTSIRKVLNRWYENSAPDTPDPSHQEVIRLFYKAHMSTAYKLDERIMKDIIKRNLHPVDDKELLFIIYYNTKKTSNFLLKNNTTPKPTAFQRSHVIYQFCCPEEDCTPPSNYIGMTSTKLTRRLTCHLQQGAPKTHMNAYHNDTLTRRMLEEKTIIIDSHPDLRRLRILEALYIKEKNPKLNNQREDLQTLPSARIISPSYGTPTYGYPRSGE